MNRIFVTGMGLISATGYSVAENREALSQGRSGISPFRLFSSKFANILPCGEIRTSNDELREKLVLSEAGITRTLLLAMHAMKEAILDAGLQVSSLNSAGTALIGSTTVGGMCLTDELYRDAQEQQQGSEYLDAYDCSSVTMNLQQHFGIGGITNTINTACSSSANAIMYGARLIRNGLAERAIVGGVDSLARFTVNGFNALHILSREACAPFDEDRKGLNLGEGAAFLVLEKESDVPPRRAYAELSGYANANDAFHASSLSDQGDGPYLAMKGAIELANLKPGDIGFINAHGTGTENNDLVESRAMLRLFEEPPIFASTKANVGHTLGAAGAIEAVFSVLNLHHQEIYPALNFSTPIQETGLRPNGKFRKISLQHVMSNSFGFGGNCSSLIFSKT